MATTDVLEELMDAEETRVRIIFDVSRQDAQELLAVLSDEHPGGTTTLAEVWPVVQRLANSVQRSMQLFDLRQERLRLNAEIGRLRQMVHDLDLMMLEVANR